MGDRMKVYEMLNKLKGTNKTIDQLNHWMYSNKIQPFSLLTKDSDDPIGEALNELELDEDLPQCLVDVIKEKPSIDETEINAFLETELVDRDIVCEGQLSLFEVEE